MDYHDAAYPMHPVYEHTIPLEDRKPVFLAQDQHKQYAPPAHQLTHWSQQSAVEELQYQQYQNSYPDPHCIQPAQANSEPRYYPSQAGSHGQGAIVFTDSFSPQQQFYAAQDDQGGLYLPPLDYSNSSSRHSSFDIGPNTPYDPTARRTSNYFSLEQNNWGQAVQQFHTVNQASKQQHEMPHYSHSSAPYGLQEEHQPFASAYYPVPLSAEHHLMQQQLSHQEQAHVPSDFQQMREMPYFDRTLDTPQFEEAVSPFFGRESFDFYNNPVHPQFQEAALSAPSARPSVSPYNHVAFLPLVEEARESPIPSESRRSLIPARQTQARRRSSNVSFAGAQLGGLTLQVKRSESQEPHAPPAVQER